MEKTKKSGFATTSLVLGIVGICTSFIPIINNISFVLGLIGIIFGIISLIKKSSKGMAIAGIMISILTVIIVINAQQALSDSLNEVSSNLDKATGKNTEEVLKNDVDVELGNFEVIKGEYEITNTKLTVKVTNKTTETKSFSIHIEAIDSTGARIDDAYVYANDLIAGQTQSFDKFTLVTSEKIEAMKNATFKIVEASIF